ncbi:hypothetical protein [Cellulomonas phragmiteti]|uniref:DUF35 domain-containing protein n=1 Tax=Cellulomonas phragmiteti TaxID=478780 RepID=A0ABQ4DRD4_9CELL|nr:hypothetical protein [Cellulomonas phragmiteti]GIG41920.1 hypothetical protein Cph01nite_36820 [Cellulomonas phragmiteti]
MRHEVEDADEICVVPGWQILHTHECPHLTAESLERLTTATPEQRDAYPMCTSCRAVLDGSRRQRFTSFEAAMEAFQAPLENRPMMREVAAELEFDEIWIPAPGPYIAVAVRRGVPAAAYFARGYVEVREPEGGYRVVALPVNSLRAGGGSAERRLEFAERATCQTCHMQLPASGRCDDCDV